MPTRNAVLAETQEKLGERPVSSGRYQNASEKSSGLAGA